MRLLIRVHLKVNQFAVVVGKYAPGRSVVLCVWLDLN